MSKKHRAPPYQAAINQKKVLTIAEVSSYTGYSIKYLYKLVYLRKIPFYKPHMGRRLFFLKEEIEQWLMHLKCLTEEEILKQVKTQTTTKKNQSNATR